MSDKDNNKKADKPPKQTPFDRGGQDFFRGSRGPEFGRNKFGFKRDFTGFRRGSK